ncbi:PP2C family protein-serine/threonine phosphatase [Nonomuraea sp. NPDC050783]|uniref:PP2C family protein-serine/threonine phosphatase n=1 Tax=Nonomuraea sp. NPDC050783 TaxID=3154634 RepID=UPI0034665E9D
MSDQVDVRALARMVAGLLDDSHGSTLDDLPALACRHAAEIGVTDVQIYLADLQQQKLRRLSGEGPEAESVRHPDELRIETSLAGRVFQDVRLLPRPATDVTPGHWWVPIIDGTSRLGVLRLTTDGHPLDHDAARLFATLVALLINSMHVTSDSYFRLIRTRPMNVAAEMQWKLMPPLTFANERVTVSATLEPAYEVGGDAFDYAVSGSVLHLAVFDAMGHDIAAGLTSNLAVAACRNHRRQGAGLAENSVAIEHVLTEEFGRGLRFVTAIMADLDMDTGVLSWISRGHHPPVVIRNGRWVSVLECPPAHPMGLDVGLPVTLCREQLQPGDRLLLYTDGVTEARDASGREFGLHRFTEFVIRHHADGLPVPETLRRLMHAVLSYHHGKLHDDATVLLTEWHGKPATEG